MIKERPIIFSGPRVRAIRAGGKTQTRRVIKQLNRGHPFMSVQPDGAGTGWVAWWPQPVSAEMTAKLYPGDQGFRCPYGVPGDRLWVREGFACGEGTRVIYQADQSHDMQRMTGWKPSIHMPRWAARLTLEVTDVRVTRLQEISEADARAEGVVRLSGIGPEQRLIDDSGRTQGTYPYTLAFAVEWDTLNDERAPWVSNPWVWTITFTLLEGGL